MTCCSAKDVSIGIDEGVVLHTREELDEGIVSTAYRRMFKEYLKDMDIFADFSNTKDELQTNCKQMENI